MWVLQVYVGIASVCGYCKCMWVLQVYVGICEYVNVCI